MDREKAWERFMQSGKVEDYLLYTQSSEAQLYMGPAPTPATEELWTDADNHTWDSAKGKGYK